MSTNKVGSKSKGGATKEEIKVVAAAVTLENAVAISSLRLIALGSSTVQFDYVRKIMNPFTENVCQSSTLFVSYLRATLCQLQNIEQGETLTIQVFGENEQFKVIGVEATLKEGVNNKVVTKDTQITIKKVDEGDRSIEEEEGDGMSDIEKMMKELTLKKASQNESGVKFGGFSHQRELL